MEQRLDLVIIGGGPAGLSAAIYAKRAMLNFVIMEKFLPGGGIANTFELENYLGVGKVTGMEMADLMTKHVNDLGIEVQSEEVKSIDYGQDLKTVKTNKNEYITKNIIIATGASPRKLGCPGEEDFMGMGVSNCATCDGFLYKEKTVMVVGGGDVAVEDAIYLSRIAKKVYLVHRRDELRAVKSLQERLFSVENVEILWSHELKEIQGDKHIEKVLVYNNKNQEERVIHLNGVFIAVGYHPNTEYLGSEIKKSEGNWIITDEHLMTNIKGVYAVGDIRDNSIRQVATAVADGALAVSEIVKHL
jgi:thioredoxin reductase (NADPH)